ncbi:hypothetical protein SUNI508_05516 [Seiridium unicorne]|uniref:Ubiquitin 3 binding protein But2 C-terminal domain-containing protein n=1 Tax=Seiridium unicorne TaxID=138068 RepID=A0ABR2V4Z4_9PEZI
MKCAVAVIALLSASGALAAPSLTWRRQYTNVTIPYQNTTVPCNGTTPTNSTIPSNSTTPSNTTTPTKYSGFVLPTLLKIHHIPTNENTEDVQIATQRNGPAETSTLYEIPVPEELAGKTCSLVIRAGLLGNGTIIQGTQAMDIFNNNIESLAKLQSGNLRNLQLARVRFDYKTSLYAFEETVLPPRIRSFPCPAGKTLEWESVAVGDFDMNVIKQDFESNGQGIPNGLSIGYY